ncbi:MAG: BLUF domain-containing protein [Pseudomonadota bacterium]
MSDATPRLSQIVYVSRALIADDGRALDAIRRVSQARNAAAGVTGVLFYDGDRFAQVLEGPWDATSLLLETIRHDPRHFDVRVLRDAPTRARRFSTWSLRMLDGAQAPGLELLLARERPSPALAIELTERLAGI